LHHSFMYLFIYLFIMSRSFPSTVGCCRSFSTRSICSNLLLTTAQILLCLFNSIFSIQFYLSSAITIQLSLGALQSPEPETPLVQAQWQHGQELGRASCRAR